MFVIAYFLSTMLTPVSYFTALCALCSHLCNCALLAVDICERVCDYSSECWCCVYSNARDIHCALRCVLPLPEHVSNQTSWPSPPQAALNPIGLEPGWWKLQWEIDCLNPLIIWISPNAGSSQHNMLFLFSFKFNKEFELLCGGNVAEYFSCETNYNLTVCKFPLTAIS